ncbi:hypothetical protein BCM20_005544 [Clostridium beijerinckii]|nr:hypothetical protein [Clostridium beijerinckii]NYC04409.1 hypothetical protein [Clostridium beijerinckii]NYC05448.1 hypothetical protein [Clostridium beijerinckii]
MLEEIKKKIYILLNKIEDERKLKIIYQFILGINGK